MTSRLAPRASRRGKDDRGMTLVEILIVMLIFSIVMTIVVTVLVSAQRDEATVVSRDTANSEAQVMVQALSRQVHAAATPAGMTSPFVLATANELLFYSALGNANGPTQLDIRPAPACSGCSTYDLVEDVVQPVLVSGVPTYTSAAQRVVLGSGLVPPTPSPTSDCSASSSFVPGIFEYSPVTGPCLALDTTASPPALDSSQFKTVENLAIAITTVDTLRPGSAPDVVTNLQVSLPNVDYQSS
ncbi:MAG: PulJ/GspJ family protein [Acidimicrobiales bacterium]